MAGYKFPLLLDFDGLRRSAQARFLTIFAAEPLIVDHTNTSHEPDTRYPCLHMSLFD